MNMLLSQASGRGSLALGAVPMIGGTGGMAGMEALALAPSPELAKKRTYMMSP
jgi:hypothetical protein